MKISICGFGFVGKALYNTFQEDVFNIYDKYKEKYNSEHQKNLLYSSDIIFIAVPTPTIKSKQDYSELEELMIFLKDYRGIIVVKSTILPSFFDLYKWENIVHYPEFLSEDHAIRDFQNQHTIILGGEPQACLDVEKFLKKYFPNSNYFQVSRKEASLIKYIHNVYGAVSVALFNTFYDIISNNGYSYNKLIEILRNLGHLDHTYIQIAKDGKRGFGGNCFCKDIVAFNTEYPSIMIGSAINQNIIYRPEEMGKVNEIS